MQDAYSPDAYSPEIPPAYKTSRLKPFLQHPVIFNHRPPVGEDLSSSLSFIKHQNLAVKTAPTTPRHLQPPTPVGEDLSSSLSFIKHQNLAVKTAPTNTEKWKNSICLCRLGFSPSNQRHKCRPKICPACESDRDCCTQRVTKFLMRLPW